MRQIHLEHIHDKAMFVMSIYCIVVSKMSIKPDVFRDNATIVNLITILYSVASV